MRFLKLTIACTIALLVLQFANAQCPAQADITATATSTKASCPSAGTITVTANVDNTATYQIIAAPAGFTKPGAQNSNVFNSVPAGNFTIKVVCGSATTNVDVTVANDHTNPTVDAVVSDVCVNGTPGGTITVSGTGRGIQYAVLKNDNAGAANNLFTYSNTTVYKVTEFGTYQVRVMDDCGIFITKTVQVLPQTPKAFFRTTGGYSYNCTQTAVGFQLNTVLTGTGATINFTNKNYKLELWESTSSGCPGKPTATPDQTITLNNTATQGSVVVSRSTLSIYTRVTSPCGEVTEGCFAVQPFVFKETSVIMLYGCGSTSTNTLSISTNSRGPLTLAIKGYDANNVEISNQSITNGSATTSYGVFGGITKAHHYTYTLSDGCSPANTLTNTINSDEYVTPRPAPQIMTNGVNGINPRCDGNLNFNIFVRNVIGYADVVVSEISLKNLSTGTVYHPTGISNLNESMGFANVPAGNYELTIDPGGTCTPTTLSVTIPATPIEYSLTATLKPLCGGTGSINAVLKNYSLLPYPYEYILKKSGTIVDRNTTGSFLNLTSGNYTVVAAVNRTCIEGGSKIFYSNEIAYTILGDGTPPAVTKKYGIACDNSTAGFATLEITGNGTTFKIEKKLASEAETAYTVVTTSAPARYKIDNLVKDQVYTFRITDECGKSSTTELSIKPLLGVAKVSTLNPCVGSPYYLTVEDIPGATYSWTKDGVAITGSTNEIYFTNYSADMDGEYVATVSFAGCVSRTVTIKLNSNNCGQALPAIFSSLEAKIVNGQLLVNWVTSSELNVALYEIEVSKDGKNFYRIGTTEPKSKDGNSSSLLEYDFATNVSSSISKVFAALSLLLLPVFWRRKNRFNNWVVSILFIITVAGFSTVSCKKNEKEAIDVDTKSIYVRIAIVDKDGSKSYSKVVKAVEE